MSAIVGLVIGDSLLFQAYILIGPRLGILLLSLSPLWGTLLAWIFLGERLSLPELAAIAIALAGVAWVVLERGRASATHETRGPGFTRGILFGLGAGLCQAAGLVLSKPALADGFPALSAVMIRMTVGMIVIWAWAAVRGEAGSTIRRLRADRRATSAIFGGAFVGPFIGVWLSLVAVQTAARGHRRDPDGDEPGAVAAAGPLGFRRTDFATRDPGHAGRDEWRGVDYSRLSFT